jgi:aryl-alcohol dehydrogenase-like predicted oxidoreductase
MTAIVRIHGTDMHVPRLSFGTASLHHLIRARDRRRLLATACAHGLTHFDCAPYYGHGLTEQDVGLFLKHRRSDCTVTTKVGLYPRGGAARGIGSVWLRKLAGRIVPGLDQPTPDWSVDRSRRSLEDSLRRLQTDHVDFLLVHEPRIDASLADELTVWLEKEMQRGTIRAYGVAGVEERVAALVRSGHRIAGVIQTKDSVPAREADFVLRAGRVLQFTYGYVSGACTTAVRNAPSASATSLVAEALARNTTGSVIISTRRAERITQLATLLA